MVALPKAVFLSYSSQDAEPARRVRDALQAAGLEVWFDQSELRGGDAWDKSIRERIKDCANSKAKLDKEAQKLVTFKKQDIFDKDFDISEATVVTLYLLPSLNVKLIPKLKTLKEGCRIVSHDFDMEGVTPEKGYPITVKAKRDNGDEAESKVYLWTTPLKLTKKD